MEKVIQPLDHDITREATSSIRGYVYQAYQSILAWMSSAVGEQVYVRAVLALPGWYIERLKSSDVLLFNGKNPLAWAGIKPENPLSDSMIQRIVHQIDQKCRDVEPAAYSKEKKSN